MAADPTFPLLSIFAFLSALLLLVLLATNVIRHSWNLGVTFLSFWLLWENLLLGVNAIIWSDNADIKLDIFCDITSHVYMFTYVVKPACTLVLTRRLYKIASMQSLIPESRKARIVDAAIEWFLGLGLPTLVTGIFYYIVQGARFQVIEGFGCENTENIDGIEILLIEAPVLILPLISLLFYCPKIIYVFFRFGRDMNHFLQTNGSISRSGYSRILILGCLDILLTLPFSTLLLVSRIRGVLKQFSLPFYFGWDATHSNWDPISLSWSVVEMSGNWAIFNVYFTRWSSVILALAIFALFGLTAESRATYSRGMLAVFKLFGWTLPEHKHDDIGSLKFGVRSLVASGQTRTQRSTFATFPEMGEAAGEDAERGIQPSIISDSSEGKITSPAIWPRLPDIGTVLTLQAEDRQVRGNSEKSNMKGGGIHVDRGSDEKAHVDIDGPHFVGIHESLRVMQPAHSDPPVEAADIV